MERGQEERRFVDCAAADVAGDIGPFSHIEKLTSGHGQRGAVVPVVSGEDGHGGKTIPDAGVAQGPQVRGAGHS